MRSSSAVVVAKTYNPVASLKVVDPGSVSEPPTFGPDYEELSKAIKSDLEERTKGLAEVISLNVTAVPLSKSTQDKIDRFTAEVANTRTKQQEKLTKIAEAEGDLARLRVDLEDLHLDLLSDLEDFIRMANAVPAQLADVHQAIDSAQIDKRAKILQAAHRSFECFSDFERGQ